MEPHRRPAVAGLFYPADPVVLKRDVLAFLSASRVESQRPPKLLIVPHAGYSYSGKIAGEAFAEASRHRYKRILLLGPSHRHYFEGIVESREPIWNSPLGETPVAFLDDGEVIKDSQYHRNEHCLEVQIPFIRCLFPEAEISPLLLSGPLSQAESFARHLVSLASDDTLWVISSDFNHTGPNFQHYPDRFGFGSGKEMDIKAIEYIAEGDIEGFAAFLNRTQATICGALPILVAMNLIKRMDIGSFQFKKYDCSGDQTGDASSVGYAALYC